MHHYRILLLLLICFFSSYVAGEEINPRCRRSTEGKEFWFGFMQGRNLSGQHYLEITVTAREATSFTIHTGKNTLPFYSGTVSDNGSTQIKIPLSLAEATGSEAIQDKALHLVSEKPVNVYALNWDANSADVAVMYPVESIGKEYFTMCYTPNVHSDLNHGRNSEFLIVASADSTKIKITPSVVTQMLKPANVAFSIILNKGEVYQVQSMNARNLSGQGDLTGSYIESDKPVAVYSGTFSTTVPAESGMGGYDHLFEQIPPLPAWGREYYAVPLLTRQSDRYRVMASSGNTRIWIGNQAPRILNRGEFYEFVLWNNEPSRIFADKPILLAQFSQSNNTDRNFTGGSGDPFMIILSPVSQSKNDVTFVTYNSNQIKTYYVNIVTPTSEVNSIELGGALIGNQFKAFPGTKFSYAQVIIGSGTYRLRNRNPNRGFLAYVYGYGGYESYGYAVGFNLDLVLDLGQSIDFEGDTLALCQGQSITLDAGPYFDNFAWSTSDTAQEIVVTREGLYYATGSTIDGCVQSDSIYILVSDPKTNIGEDKSGCAPYSVQLNGGNGFARYEWNTGETTRNISVGKTGEYIVTAYDKYGCPATDTMRLTVFPVPVVEIESESLLCGTKTTGLKANITGTASEVWQGGTFSWTASQAGNHSFEKPSFTSSQMEVAGWGKYDVKYELTTIDDCKASDDITIGFYPVPEADFIYADDPNDKCKGYSREIRYTGNATKEAAFYWDYGGSTMTDSLDWNARRVSVGVFNSNPYVTLYVEENGCWSDTTRKALGANPDFTMNTVKSRGCDTATIFFSGELKVEDDLLFEWDFGDGSAISNLRSPSHFYAGTGFYNVGLQITNKLTNCKIGFRVEEMVKVFPTPEARLSVDTSFCHDQVIDVIYTLNNDSSICFWEFDGARKVGNGNDSIRVFLENQMAKIRLMADEYGCKSQWTEAQVKRKPVFDFQTDLTSGCQPLQVMAEAKSEDEYIDFLWLTDSVNTSGYDHSLYISRPGSYPVTVAGYSALTGCADTLIKIDLVYVFPKPVAEFSVDYPVAILGQSNLNFSNQTRMADLFYWDFADGYTSTEKNPRHNFTERGNFPVRLEVESDDGCLDTMIMDIEIIPFDVFTPNAFRPDSDIPENRVFMPLTMGVDPQKFHIQVFNRWGQMVFESRNPDHKWDGKLGNLQNAPMGNYVWQADYTDIQGYRHTLTGQVLLVR